MLINPQPRRLLLEREGDGLGLAWVELQPERGGERRVLNRHDRDERGQRNCGKAAACGGKPADFLFHRRWNQDATIEPFQQTLLSDHREVQDRRRVADDTQWAGVELSVRKSSAQSSAV